MSSGLLILITAFCSIIGILSIVILLAFNKQNVFANRLLALSLFGLTWIWISDVLIQSRWMLSVPHLHLLSHPLHFIIAPAAYLYVRAVLNNEQRFRPYDWIHLMPFLLHALELVPFYLQGAEYKRSVIQEHLANPELVSQLHEGYLPPYVHLHLKILLALVYNIFQWQLVIPFFRQHRRAAFSAGRSLARWLASYTALMGLLYLSTGIALLSGFPVNTAYVAMRVPLGLTNLGVLLFLMFRPSILYGIMPQHGSIDSTPQPKPSDNKPFLLSEEQILMYKDRVERYMEEEKPYLDPGLSLDLLADQLQIPRHHLSAFINTSYKVNFKDFVNRYRIRFLCESIEADKWNLLTLEGIAREAGFNSRSTFHKAFKKFTGINPSEYKRNMESGAAI
jgi:AraC-like DNA-binding protein